MTLGTLYVNAQFPRNSHVLKLVRYLGLDIDIVDVREINNYAEIYALHKVPYFLGTDGFKLPEAYAVVCYLIDLSGDHGDLLGRSTKEKALNTAWYSLVNMEIIQRYGVLLSGKTQQAKDKATAELHGLLEYIDDALATREFLIGNSFTVSDLFAHDAIKTLHGLNNDFKSYTNINRYLGSCGCHPCIAPYT